MKKIKAAISVLISVIIIFSVCCIANAEEVIAETESNNDYESANVVSVNAQINGVLSVWDDCDYYKVTADVNGKLELTFKHISVDKDNGWTVRIYYFDGNEYVELSYTEIRLLGSETVKLPTVGMISGGEYYIVVKDWWNGYSVGTDYTIENKFTATEYYEKETNDSWSTSTKTELNQTYGGTINRENDSDYYKVVADANGKLELAFKHSTVDKDNGWVVRTYYYDGNEYVELSYTEIRLLGSESVKLPTVGMISGGEYYIVVKDWWNGYSVGTDYTIENKFTATECYEKETNDSWSTSTKTELNQTYGGTINRENDSDYYKIVADANGKLELAFKHSTVDKDNGWVVRTYYYDGNEYVELSYTEIRLLGSESVKLPTVGMISGGEYYIVVKDWWNGYSVGTDYTIENKFTATEYYEKETNDSWSTSTKTELNQTYGGTINRENDSDYYKVVADTNGKLELTFKHTTVDKDNGWRVRIYFYNGDKYEELSSTEIELLGDEIIELPNIGVISGGKYYIVVSDWWDGRSIGHDYTIENKFIPDGYEDEPTTQPTEPTTQPTTQPTEPSTQPTTKPTEPTTEPSTAKPTEPTTNPTEPVTEPSTKKPETTQLTVVVKVKTPSQSTINYGDSIILHAEVKNLPEGAEIVWSANNANFKIVSTSADGMSCTVTPVSSGDTVFTATVVDKDGKEITNDEQIMNSKAGIWQKIVAFFKNLFGLTKVIPEVFKNVF